MLALPIELHRDAIAEAICEVRFECHESVAVPEIVVGRLADFPFWRDYDQVRLPISDVPAPVRASDPNLKIQPTLELRDQHSNRLAKVGVNVLSYHRLDPYPGWATYRPEIDQVVDFLFSAFKSFKATRLGFRYVNLFTAVDHGVVDVSNLRYSVDIAGDTLIGPQNLNYLQIRSDQHSVVVRIASPEFITGPASKKAEVLVDLDVFTPADFETDDVDVVKSWIEEAHTYEKEEFFRLFTDEMMQRLVKVGP